MSAGVSFLTDAYRNAVQKRTQLEPAEWCRENVSLFRSTDSSSYRPEFTPWWSEPMKEIRDNSNRVICITTPVGSGKSFQPRGEFRKDRRIILIGDPSNFS